ncbi:MAG: DTW domain-containing protein [Oligoflexia bacterium]|nr:DTW domain-containing protein [Oligoflexia bacterium]
MRVKIANTHRCPKCRMLHDLCICQALPRIEINTRLVVAMHIAEKNKPTNSARLLQSMVNATETRYQGLQDQPLNLDDLAKSDRAVFVLFPEGSYSPSDLLGLGKPVTLIVPDGTWQQAKRIVHHITEHYRFPRVSVPLGAGGAYKLRSADRADRLSTLEATARLLGVLEGAEVQAQLEQAFQLMVSRVLESRQRSKRNSVA